MAEKAAEKAAVEVEKEEYMAGPLLSEVEEELRDADAPQATQQAEKAAVEAKKEEYMAGPLLSE